MMKCILQNAGPFIASCIIGMLTPIYNSKAAAKLQPKTQHGKESARILILSFKLPLQHCIMISHLCCSNLKVACLAST